MTEIEVRIVGEGELDVQVDFLDLPEKGVDAEKLAKELAKAVREIVEKHLE